MSAVEFDNVSIVFGDDPDSALPLMDKGMERPEIRRACGQVLGVHDCSLTVEEGEILVLMGLSGSGKSTLLRAVNGLNPVVRGDVRVKTRKGMRSVTQADAKTLRDLRLHDVAMVFQQFGLLPWRTVRDNVGLGLELDGQSAAQRRARVDEELKLVGLADRADALVGELSGGMQQRVGLARALANDAPLLLMDEAFSALDPLIRMDMQSILLDLQKELRKTVVFITHDLDEALRLGDRIAILRDGEIVQQGTGQDIVLSPADDYIENFVKEVNRGRVVLVESVMDSGPDASASVTVGPGTQLEAAARAMSEAGVRVANVTDGDDRVVGHVGLDRTVAAMVQRRTVHEPSTSA